MNCDALEKLIYGRQQPRNLQIGSLAQQVKRPRAVFAAAPAQ